MSIVDKIKAKQIADALEQGEQNPYLKPKGPPPIVAASLGKAARIKQAQLEKDPEFYAQADSLQSTETASLKGAGQMMFEQLQAALVTDIARIKTHKKLADKQALKATLLPNYLPFVVAYIKDGHDYPNNVALMCMVWSFDILDIETGISIAKYLIESKQQLPANFNRDIPTFMCDAVYDWANDQLKSKQSAQPYLGQVAALVRDSDWDLHPAVQSKMYVMAAKHAFELGEFGSCLKWCVDAETANPDGAGVKTLKANAIKAMAQ